MTKSKIIVTALVVAGSFVPAVITAAPAWADPNIGRLVGVAIVDDVAYLVYEVPGGYRLVPM